MMASVFGRQANDALNVPRHMKNTHDVQRVFRAALTGK
jgi:hypothetical protein